MAASNTTHESTRWCCNMAVSIRVRIGRKDRPKGGYSECFKQTRSEPPSYMAWLAGAG